MIPHRSQRQTFQDQSKIFTVDVNVLAAVCAARIIGAVERNGEIGVLDPVPARTEVVVGVVERRWKRQ